MFCKSLMVLAGGAAIVVSGPALAAPGGGNGGGGAHGGGAIGAGAGLNGGGMGPAQASPNASFNRPMTPTAPNITNNTATTGVQANVNAGSQAVVHSQGPLHASPNGIAHASPDSVLARGAVTSTALPGLASGLTVRNSTGTSIGTVSQVITGSDGSIRAVVVTSPSGQTFRLAPTTLSISGSVVTTTSTTVGG